MKQESNTTNSELEPIMTTYLLTKEQLEELLGKQRELCADTAKVKYYDRGNTGSIFPSYCYVVDHESILTSPPPPLPVNKESVIDLEGLVTGDKSLSSDKGDAPLKTCAAIEQGDKRTMTLDQIKTLACDFYFECYIDKAAGYQHIRSEYDKWINENPFYKATRWGLLNKVQNVEVSDTTEDHSSNEADKQNNSNQISGNIKIDWERIEEEAKKKFYWNYNSEWINWLKTNLPNYIK